MENRESFGYSTPASRKSKSEKAGITFPVSRVHRLLRKGKYAKRIGDGGAVFLAVVLEYLVAEVLELSAARQNKKVLITPRHIMLAIRTDDELNKLLRHIQIPYAGVPSHIHSSLLPKKAKENKKSHEKGM